MHSKLEFEEKRRLNLMVKEELNNYASKASTEFPPTKNRSNAMSTTALDIRDKVMQRNTVEKMKIHSLQEFKRLSTN
jgi:hypothetical protein